MPSKLALFLQKTYGLFIFSFFLICFFIFYSLYLVDYSLINLKVALDKTAQAQTTKDFEKIGSLLKMPLLKELANKSLSSRTLLSLEIVDNLTRTAKDKEQIADIRFYLTTAIEEKEKPRAAIINILDRITILIFGPQTKFPHAKILSDINRLLAKIKTSTDKDFLQRAYFDLGNLYMQIDLSQQASDAFLKAMNIYPNTPLAIKSEFNLAWVYKYSGQFDQAVSCFDRISQEYAEKEVQIFSQYEIADVCYKQGEFGKASGKYGVLADEYPQFNVAELALYEAGYISFYNLDNIDTALKYFNKLQEKYPKAKIIQHLMTKIRPFMAYRFRIRGFQLLKEEKYSEAIGSFNRAVEISPLDGNSFSGMGLGFFWLDEKQEALSKGKKAVEVSKNSEIAIINTMFIYINTSRIDEAIALGKRALSGQVMKIPEFYYNMGYAYMLKPNINIATIYFREAIKRNPDYVAAYNNLGCAFWSAKRYGEAIKKFKQAIDREPAYLQAHFNLGVVYYELNRLEEAYQEFKKVLRINPRYRRAEEFQRRITEILKYEPQ